MRRRVAVTGMGVVTPLGSTPDELRSNLLAGVSGVGPITVFDPAALPTRIAAEARLPAGVTAERDRKLTFAHLAAEGAITGASRSGPLPPGGGISLALGLELFSLEDMVTLRAPGFVLPATLGERMRFLQTPADVCVHQIAARFGLSAPPLTHVSACAAGADALGYAFRAVAGGRLPWMLAGGADSMINPLGVAGFCSIRATSTANDRPQTAIRPFDARRDGFVLGEGAALLVLEDLDAARARGAHVYGEVAGFGNSLDADEITRPHPDGRGALQAMRRALDDAGITAEDVDAVSAHGTSTPLNDAVETLALNRLLGARARAVPVCAPKSMLGHLIAAAGAVEAAAALLCMEAGIVHPTINLEHPDPACDLDYVPGAARRHPQRWTLSNSFGFGGQNACLVLRRGDAA